MFMNSNLKKLRLKFPATKSTFTVCMKGKVDRIYIFGDEYCSNPSTMGNKVQIGM